MDRLLAAGLNNNTHLPQGLSVDTSTNTVILNSPTNNPSEPEIPTEAATPPPPPSPAMPVMPRPRIPSFGESKSNIPPRTGHDILDGNVLMPKKNILIDDDFDHTAPVSSAGSINDGVAKSEPLPLPTPETGITKLPGMITKMAMQNGSALTGFAPNTGSTEPEVVGIVSKVSDDLAEEVTIEGAALVLETNENLNDEREIKMPTVNNYSTTVFESCQSPEVVNVPETVMPPAPMEFPVSNALEEKIPPIIIKAPEVIKTSEALMFPEPIKTLGPINAPDPIKVPEPVKDLERTKASELQKSPEPMKTLDSVQDEGSITESECIKSPEPVRASEPIKSAEPVTCLSPTETPNSNISLDPIKISEPINGHEPDKSPKPAEDIQSIKNPELKSLEPVKSPESVKDRKSVV